MYPYKFKALVISLFILLVPGLSRMNAQPSYRDFKNSYKPHNKRNDATNKAVCLIGYMSDDAAAALLEEYIKNNDSKLFTLIITSLERQKAGAVIDKMERSFAVKGLKMLSPEWEYEIVYYVSERTYRHIDNKLPALEQYPLH